MDSLDVIFITHSRSCLVSESHPLHQNCLESCNKIVSVWYQLIGKIIISRILLLLMWKRYFCLQNTSFYNNTVYFEGKYFYSILYLLSDGICKYIRHFLQDSMLLLGVGCLIIFSSWLWFLTRNICLKWWLIVQ